MGWGEAQGPASGGRAGNAARPVEPIRPDGTVTKPSSRPTPSAGPPPVDPDLRHELRQALAETEAVSLDDLDRCADAVVDAWRQWAIRGGRS